MPRSLSCQGLSLSRELPGIGEVFVMTNGIIKGGRRHIPVNAMIIVKIMVRYPIRLCHLKFHFKDLDSRFTLSLALTDDERASLRNECGKMNSRIPEIQRNMIMIAIMSTTIRPVSPNNSPL